MIKMVSTCCLNQKTARGLSFKDIFGFDLFYLIVLKSFLNGSEEKKLGLKRRLVPKKMLVQKNCWSQKNVGSQKNCWLVGCCVQIKFVPQKNLLKKKSWLQNKFDTDCFGPSKKTFEVFLLFDHNIVMSCAVF